MKNRPNPNIFSFCRSVYQFFIIDAALLCSIEGKHINHTLQQTNLSKQAFCSWKHFDLQFATEDRNRSVPYVNDRSPPEWLDSSVDTKQNGDEHVEWARSERFEWITKDETLTALNAFLADVRMWVRTPAVRTSAHAPVSLESDENKHACFFYLSSVSPMPSYGFKYSIPSPFLCSRLPLTLSPSFHSPHTWHWSPFSYS